MKLDSLDLSSNFWKVNPNFTVISLFKELSKTKNSSDIMWAIVCRYYYDSPYKNLQDKDKIKLIEKDILKTNKFDWKEYDEVIKEFINFITPKAKKLLLDWEKKLEERTEFIQSLKYDSSTYEMLDKLMTASDKLWTSYVKILKDLDADDNDGQTVAGSEESLSEKGII